MQPKTGLSPTSILQGILMITGLVLLVIFGQRAMSQASSWEAVNGKPFLVPQLAAAGRTAVAVESFELWHQRTIAEAAVPVPHTPRAVSQAPLAPDPQPVLEDVPHTAANASLRAARHAQQQARLEERHEAVHTKQSVLQPATPPVSSPRQR